MVKRFVLKSILLILMMFIVLNSSFSVSNEHQIGYYDKEYYEDDYYDKDYNSDNEDSYYDKDYDSDNEDSYYDKDYDEDHYSKDGKEYSEDDYYDNSSNKNEVENDSSNKSNEERFMRYVPLKKKNENDEDEKPIIKITDIKSSIVVQVTINTNKHDYILAGCQSFGVPSLDEDVVRSLKKYKNKVVEVEYEPLSGITDGMVYVYLYYEKSKNEKICINEEMIKTGNLISDRTHKYKRIRSFEYAEKEAMDAEVGIWKDFANTKRENPFERDLTKLSGETPLVRTRPETANDTSSDTATEPSSVISDSTKDKMVIEDNLDPSEINESIIAYKFIEGDQLNYNFNLALHVSMASMYLDETQEMKIDVKGTVEFNVKDVNSDGSAKLSFRFVDTTLSATDPSGKENTEDLNQEDSYFTFMISSTGEISDLVSEKESDAEMVNTFEFLLKIFFLQYSESSVKENDHWDSEFSTNMDFGGESLDLTIDQRNILDSYSEDEEKLVAEIDSNNKLGSKYNGSEDIDMSVPASSSGSVYFNITDGCIKKQLLDINGEINISAQGQSIYTAAFSGQFFAEKQ